MAHLTRPTLERLWASEPAPGVVGELVAIVRRLPRRPLPDGTFKGSSARELPREAMLTIEDGLVGDRWRAEEPEPECQVTVMEARVIRCLVGGPDLLGAVPWGGPGDNLVVGFDLSVASLPVGAWLGIGEAVLEVTPEPHLGCRIFGERYGTEALAWVNGPEGRRLRLRGLNARVVQAGLVRVGDRVRRVERGA